MDIFFYFILGIFGTLFGSFASVLIYRLQSGENGILTGRSHCKECHKELKFNDLFPIFSWVYNFGKCRYCKKNISSLYPLLEISMGVIFVLVGIYLIDIHQIMVGNIEEIGKLYFYLTISFITIVYIFYDILFLEIHEGVMLSGISIAFLGNIIHSYVIYGFSEAFIMTIFGIIVLLFLYIIMCKELKEIYDIGLLCISVIFSLLWISRFPNLIYEPIFSGIIGAGVIFIFFYLQILLSRGKALGGGDLRIGIMIGLILGIPDSFISILLTYILGSLIGICIIIKNWKKPEPNIVPFGPFLGISFFIVLFFGEGIINYLEKYIWLM